MTEKERLDWLKERQLGIGGSDVAPILGIPSYKGASPHQVWRSKTEPVSVVDTETEAMNWGNALEPVLIKEYSKRTGVFIKGTPGCVAHDDHPCLMGTPDQYVECPTFGPGLLEIKNNSFGFKWGNPDDDASISVPPHYYVQVLHYMDVTNRGWADIAVLISGTKFLIHRVEDNPTYRLANRAKILEWWDRHIVNGEEPEAINPPDAASKYPVAEGGEVLATDEMQSLVNELIVAKSIHGSSSMDVDKLKTKLMELMGDTELLVNEEGRKLISWKNPTPGRRIDKKKLRKEFPIAYEECLEINQSSRRFVIHAEAK